MRVCTLSSSSKGNCTIVYTQSTIILIDIGITLSVLEQKLQTLNIAPQDVDAVLVTHEHIDHTKSVGTFFRKYRKPIYCHKDAYNGIATRIGNVDYQKMFGFECKTFEIGDIEITPFCVPHDAPSCVGFTFKNGNNQASIVTDLGHINSTIMQNLFESKLVILEANHDEDRLMANPNYSYALKKRILGKNGHLSNSTSAIVISELATHGVKQILLAHLSEENNTPQICYNTICNYLNSVGIKPNINIKIDIAPPRNISPIFYLK